MKGKICILGLAALALALPVVAACDDLEVPPSPDGGPAGTNPEGGTRVSLPAYVPANAPVGDVVSAMNSTLATWATVDASNKVTAVHWNLPLTAIAALDGAKFDARVWLNIPAQATKDTAMTGFAIDYLPLGHLPNGVYNVAHWEFHIIFQNFAEVRSIDCADPTLPAQPIVPQTYSVLPPPDNCFPAMGIHAIHLGAPEFRGEKFTYSNMLVFYRGNGSLKDQGARVASFEPKVTAQALRERKSFSMDLPILPAGSIGRTGTVPTKLVGTYDAPNDVYLFTASDWVPAS